VYVKENFKWDIRERFKKYNKNHWIWSDQDLIDYGNFTVLKLEVYGNSYYYN